jgi:hypothetical protein
MFGMSSNKATSDPNETYSQVSEEEVSDKGTFNGKPDPKLPWPIEMLPPHSLRPAQRNARTHSKKQVRQIADSMARFGVTNPLIADDRGRIVAGHARAEAAKLLGLKQIPVIRLSHLNETETPALHAGEAEGLAAIGRRWR